MASPAPQIQSRHLDNQGFLIGEHRLRDMAKGIDRIADNSAEILTILKQLRDQQNQTNPSASPPPTSQQRTGNGRVLRILPDLPPTIHSNDARQGRQSSNAGSRGASNPPDPIPNSQLDRNQSARRNGIYNGDTVNSNEIRDRQRDTRGRFTGGNQRGDAGGDQDSIPSRVAEAVKDGMLESAKVAAPKGVDPTLDALHEMGSAMEPIKGLFGRREKIPKEQARHNKIELKWLRRIAEQRQNAGAGGGSLLGAGLLRMLPMILSGLGGLVAAVVSGLTAAAPLIAAALAAALVAWLAKKAWDKAGEIADEKRAPEQGDVNPDGSSNKGVIGLLNRGAKGIMNGVRGGLNSANEALGGDGDYWDDGTAPDSKNRVGLKTDAVNGGTYNRKLGTRTNAINTANQWKAGNIGGLDDAMTRRLVASTVATESAGGNTAARNKQGYLGRYQAGAAWLADAGMIKGGNDAVKKAMAGYNSEWAWAESGGMTKFLQDPKNWVEGMDYDKYRNSAEAQDKSFQVATSKNYARLKDTGLLQGKSDAEIAGLLKSAHIGGMGGAKAVAKGGEGRADANGTTPRKYFNDIALDKDGFSKLPASVDNQIPTTLAKPDQTNANPVISKAATNMNGVSGGQTNSNSFAPAQGISGVAQPVLPPPAQPIKLPDVPPQKQKLTSDAPQLVQVTNANDNIPQNVGDRDLAHAITGGLGMRK